MTELESSLDLKALLSTASFKDLLAKIDAETVTKEPRSTVASRAQATAQALAELDEDTLLQLQEVLSSYVDALAKDIVAFDADGAALVPKQLTYLMRRHLDTKRIEELTAVVYAGLKRIVGEAITAKVAREHPDEPFPEHVSESIDVPELGMRFCKEGAGRKAPLIDLEKLRTDLGEEMWAQVTETVTIPARTETRLSDFKLMAKAIADPAVLHKIEAALIPTGWKSWSYTVRPTKQKT